MDREVDLTREQGPLDLPDEDPASADGGKRTIRHAIPLRHDRHKLETVFWVRGSEAVPHKGRLNRREP